jgi:dipeptidyl aminopeptidase/acylaminoacyl peptidase
MQDDVTDAVKAMVEQGVADPGRICIAGASYGGYAALAGAAFSPDLYACAISINGVSDLPLMLGYEKLSTGSESDSVAYWAEHIGSPTDENVIARSPARAAKGIRAPILLLHGGSDTVVPPIQAQVMIKALQAQGKAHRFVELPGEDHWLSRSDSRIRVLTEMETFLAEHLSPQPLSGG